MTDGEPSDDINLASERIRALCQNKKLTVFPIAIGAAANLEARHAVTRSATIAIERTQLQRIFPMAQPQRIASVAIDAWGDCDIG